MAFGHLEGRPFTPFVTLEVELAGFLVTEVEVALDFSFEVHGSGSGSTAP